MRLRTVMAAMIAGTSRCIPRVFCQISKCRCTLSIQKARQISVLSRNLQNGQFSSRLSGVSRIQSGVWVCHHHKIARKFHTSLVFCDEVKIVSCPPFAESITEGDIRWEKGVGDTVAIDEVLGEIETDKTSIPVPSTVAGVIEELLVEDGSTVEAGAQLCKIRAGGEAAVKPSAPAPEPVKEAAPPPPLPPQPTPTAPPPPPPPQAAAAGPVPTTMPPVPPVPMAPMSSTPASAVKPIAAVPPMVGEVATGGGRTESRVKMNRMRQRIAQRLKDAQNTCAMLTTFNEIDMSNIIELRTKYKDSFLKKHNIKLSFMSAFIKASAYALQEQPVVNAVIEDLDMVYRDYIDISVAVATPKGLVVPVIRNVETMSYKDIEVAMNLLGEKARAGTLAIEDMDGGTFSISNGGVFGSMFGTPIINPPQSAILGMHAIFDRPVAVNGKIEIRPMMYVALTYDHRLIDGREAVTFLRKIKSAVEDPRVILLDL